VAAEVLHGVYRNPVVQDRFQKGVLAELAGELYRYWPTTHDLAYLAWVGVPPSPGEQVTDDDEVSSRRAGCSLTCRDGDKRIGGVSLEALALGAGAVIGSPGALCGQLDAVDERHTRLWWESTCKTDHPELVSPVAEVPGAKLLAM
jgi:hypothetical protein